MYNLTPRQKEVLHYVVQYTFEHLYQPSLREICNYLGVTSTNAASAHLRALERKGFVSGSRNARALEFSDDALLFVKCSDHLRARPIVLVKE